MQPLSTLQWMDCAGHRSICPCSHFKLASALTAAYFRCATQLPKTRMPGGNWVRRCIVVRRGASWQPCTPCDAPPTLLADTLPPPTSLTPPQLTPPAHPEHHHDPATTTPDRTLAPAQLPSTHSARARP
eukprot:28588-Rhodomonas_salina.2